MRHKCDRGRENRTAGVGIAEVGVGGMIQHNVALLLQQLVIRRYAEPPFNLHLNTFQSTHSFAFISPIIFENGQMSRQHNAGAHHRPGEAHTWCQFSPLGAFSWPYPDLTTAALPNPGDFSIGSARGDKIVLLIEFFFHPQIPPPLLLCLAIPLSPSLPPSASLGVYLRAMGKGQANDSQWLLISTICSALGPLISERKSNMWRESDRQRPSLSNRAIVHWRSAFKHEGPSNSFSTSPLCLSRATKQAYLCSDLCCSQLLLLICAAMEGKYFITFFE